MIEQAGTDHVTAMKTVMKLRQVVLAWLKRLVPLAFSSGLLAYLVYRVSVIELLSAFAEIPWSLLVPATVAMVFALYLWDAVCLQTVFSERPGELRYGEMVRVRGLSYLAGAYNYELGQALIAWTVSRRLNVTFLSTISRTVLLLFHDLLVLTSLGLLASLPSVDPRLRYARLFCLLSVVVLTGAAVLFNVLPQAWHRYLNRTKWGAWSESWDLRRSITLLFLRTVYFGILIVYAVFAFRVCRIELDILVIFSTIPLVLVADGLPSVSGLGTRESALLLLLQPDDPRILLALSIVWSTGMLVVRLAIGLCHFWGCVSGRR